MNKNEWLWLLCGVAVFGFILLTARRKNSNAQVVREVQLAPVRRRTQPASYKNTETLDITWNDDGLPVKVVIHRDAQIA